MLGRDRVPGGRELVAECEAFLTGRYVDHLVEVGDFLPAWAWTNLLAHGTPEQLAAAAHGPRVVGAEPWSAAQSYLAGEVIDLAARNGPLETVQARTLVPLELDLISQPHARLWTPGDWVAAVLVALAPLSGWRPARPRRP